MEIQIKKFSFISRFDNVPIHGICMIPEHPIGIFQMVHGMCEHKGRYHSFMRNMAERGFVTLMHDGRGHGESLKEDSDIGYCYESMESGYVADIYRIVCQIKREYPELPLILYGHSLGSLAVRVFLRNHDDLIDGLVLAGSPAYYSMVPGAIFLTRVVKRCLGERYRLAFAQKLLVNQYDKRFRNERRENAWLATKKSVAEEFGKDKLCTFTYSLNAFEMLLNMEYITYRAIGYQVKNEKMPILFISGMEDPCYGNEKKWKQALNRMSDLGYRNIREIRYENMRHEVHNEEDNAMVYNDLEAFCKDVICLNSGCKKGVSEL